MAWKKKMGWKKLHSAVSLVHFIVPGRIYSWPTSSASLSSGELWWSVNVLHSLTSNCIARTLKKSFCVTLNQTISWVNTILSKRYSILSKINIIFFSSILFGVFIQKQYSKTKKKKQGKIQSIAIHRFIHCYILSLEFTWDKSATFISQSFAHTFKHICRRRIYNSYNIEYRVDIFLPPLTLVGYI